MTIPAYLDRQALARHISKCPKTVDIWVRLGKLPPPKPSGLWKWTEVEHYLDHGSDTTSDSPSPFTPEAIRASTERALRSHRG